MTGRAVVHCTGPNHAVEGGQRIDEYTIRLDNISQTRASGDIIFDPCLRASDYVQVGFAVGPEGLSRQAYSVPDMLTIMNSVGFVWKNRWSAHPDASHSASSKPRCRSRIRDNTSSSIHIQIPPSDLPEISICILNWLTLWED